MRASKFDMPITLNNDEVTTREAEWGDMHVAIETYNQRFDVAPYLKGLPDNRDACPHWGYVLKGQAHVFYKDREEILKAGDLYYMEPGHTIIVEAGTEIVEFSPKDLYRKTIEVIERNMNAMEKVT